jgi:hypothetical protein
MSNLVFLPAHELAQMIRDREVSAVEQWKPPKFDWTAAQTLYYKMAAYNYRYAQPPTLNAAQKSFTFL